MILTVANESNEDFTFHGPDEYYISQGRTFQSASNNMIKYLRRIHRYFEFENDVVGQDITEFLRNKFARWQDGKDTWEDQNSWTNQFTFKFPRSNRAEIIEISPDMFNSIVEELT